MDIIAYKLNSDKFIKLYKDVCMTTPIGLYNKTLISVTFTLNPKCYNLDILTQYQKIIREIKCSSIYHHRYNSKKETWSINQGFHELYLCPELTQKMVVHLHGVLVIDECQIHIIHNEIKRVCNNSEILGRQFAFKPINDTLKDRSRLADYPFKDTEELLKFPDSNRIYYISIKKII